MKLRHPVLALAAFLVALPAGAVTTCTLSLGSLAFGIYAGAQMPSSAPLSFACQDDTNKGVKVDYTVSLSTGGSGSYAQRYMTRTILPVDTLNYNLYLNVVPAVLNTSVWGDGTGGTVQVVGRLNLPGNGTQRTDSYTVAGAIPAGPVPSAGNYIDTIVVTVIFNPI